MSISARCPLKHLFMLLLVIIAGDMIGAIRAPATTTHSNFLQAAVHGGRHQRLVCDNDPNICLDEEKNPWGGTTCCFRRFCEDTANDRNHCGACGRRCGHGLICCGGRCVDVRSDPMHCGSCYETCLSRCSFGMCSYGGGDP